MSSSDSSISSDDDSSTDSDSSAIQTRCCKKCNNMMPITDFRPGRAWCRPCLNIKSYEWQSNNKDKMEIYRQKSKENSLIKSEKEIIPDGHKLCKKCNIIHPIDLFKPGKSNCYPCQKIMSNNWKKNNRKKVAEYNKVYKQENKEKIKENNALYVAQKKINDPSFAIACTLRSRIYYVLNGKEKADHTLDLLGCSLEYFKAWLNYRFKSDMTFKNHGEVWHIDHVIPCSQFNLTIDSEQQKCFHWTNMQPLYASDNLRKSNKATKKEIEEHEEQIIKFMKEQKDTFIDQYTLIDIDRLSYILSNSSI